MTYRKTENDEWQYLNRVILAQITHINTDNGTCNVACLDNMCTQRHNLELPWSGMSFNGQNSSWMRYMPQLSDPFYDTKGNRKGGGGDWVYVGFSTRNEARILGYATPIGGYAAFNAGKTSNPTAIPVGDFQTLKQGEWDLRSTGGAYIFGQKSGALLMQAGPFTKILLDKQNNEARAESGLWAFGSTGSELRIGDVKRLATSYKETDVSLIDPTAQKEFSVYLENPGLPGTATLIAELEMGAVRNSLGIPSVSAQEAPLRHRHRIYVPGQLSVDPSPIEAYSNEIDTDGNQTVSYGDTATNVSVEGGIATDISMNAATLETSTTGATSIASDTVAQVNAPSIVLGSIAGAAAHPAVHGDRLVVRLQAVAAAFDALVAALTVAPQSPLITTPFISPSAITTIAALNAVAGAFHTALAPDAVPGPASVLSAKVKVE
jgi:hypothetical protein